MKTILATSCIILTFMHVNIHAQYYVSPHGNDANPGTSADHAFASLDAAQKAMRKSNTKTTYVCAGTYSLTAQYIENGSKSYGLILNKADEGETWSYYPADGYNSAVLDGGSSTPDNGLWGVVYLGGCKDVTWNGIAIQHFVWNGIFINNSPNTTVTNCIIHDGTFSMNGNGKNASNAGAILATQSPGLMVSNNAVYHIAYCGIEAISSKEANMNNTVIKNNVVLNTMSGFQNGEPIKDGAAIYMQDLTQSSTGLEVKNNFIRDYGTPKSESKGIYFDAGTCNASATGNIISGKGMYAIQYFAGSNIKVTGNIIDLGSSGEQFIALYQNFTNGNQMTGNVFSNNIIIDGSQNGSKGWLRSGIMKLPCSPPVIKNNFYFNYRGVTVNSNGKGMNGDESPMNENPQICGELYTINSGSPVFQSPFNFPPIEGNWGPPGYVIPVPETKTSCPPCR